MFTTKPPSTLVKLDNKYTGTDIILIMKLDNKYTGTDIILLTIYFFYLQVKLYYPVQPAVIT